MITGDIKTRIDQIWNTFWTNIDSTPIPYQISPRFVAGLLEARCNPHTDPPFGKGVH